MPANEVKDQVVLKVDHLKTYFDVTKGLFAKKQVV